MSKTTIEAGGFELDLAKGIGFGLNYAISDIKKLEKKNSNYSKTITLAGSKNNNKFFANLYDVNSDFTFFNPNIKTDAKITLDSSTVMNGFLRLNSIEKDTDSNLSGNKIVYKCTVSSKSADFYSEIKDKKLTDLDFSRYDHDYTHSNIESSWGHTSSDVYVYPLLHKASNDYLTKDFAPAIFHKSYLKRIAQEAGYTLGGSLLDESTEVGFHYSKEIIPYNGDAPILNEAKADLRKFKVGLTNPSQEIIKFVNDNNYYFATTNFLDNETTNGNFDNNNNYNPATYINTISENGSYSFELTVNTKVTVDSTNSFTIPEDPSLIHHVYYLLFVNGVQEGVMYVPITDIPLINAASSYLGSKEVLASVVFPPLNLVIGDEVQVFNQVAFNMSNTYNFAGAEVTYDVLKTDTSFLNIPQLHNLTDDDDIVLGDFIPKEHKQSDIITDLVKRYGAYISIDKDNDRKLIIDDRDSYYAKGIDLDWSDKRDFGSKAVIKLLSELQKKEMDFSYTADTDDYNKNYSKATDGDVYGVKKITFDNEFVSGVNKITTPFSPTPLIYNSPNPVAIIPSISTIEPKNKIRVLYYGGLIDCINDGSFNFDSVNAGVPTTTTYTQYPYAGHYDNPITPSIDINFGEVPYTWYTGVVNNTNANQYNRFWSNYVNQINEGRLVTYSMNLNEVDINFIKNNLNSRIFVNDAWFYINKIVDYNPIDLGLTKVEFNKINEGVEFVQENTEFSQVLTDSEILFRTANLEETTTNLSRSSNVSMTGENNYIGKNSEGSIISGENNYIGDNVENGFIIGTSNKSISISGEGWIGDTEYKNGTPIEQNGFIDYNDLRTSTNPVTLVKNVWTDIPNDTLGAYTNTGYAPTGVDSLMDGTTGYLDFSDLTLGSDVLIRIDFIVTPSTNNALLETRYELGEGEGIYNLPISSRRLDSGSGIGYSSEKGSFYIYMGDANTLAGSGKLQIRLSSDGSVINNGVAIKIYKK